MMMKVTKKLFAALLITFATGSVFAQVQERTYTLDPQQVPAQPQGYKISGRWVVKNGVDTYFNGCGENLITTEHNADIHNESGSSGGFSFSNVSIMTPDCLGKGDPDPEIPAGYIQLREFTEFGKYVTNPNDPTITAFGRIISPTVRNIKSLTIMAGGDVSMNDNRSVTFAIEASEDNGQTWDPYVVQVLDKQGGTTYTYTAGGNNAGFNALANRSNGRDMLLRVLPWRGTRRDDLSGDRGQRLKVFGMSMVATGAAVTSLRSELADNEPFFEIKDNSFVATNNKGSLFVYNLTGALIGSGTDVVIPGKGLYIVRSDKGLSKKVFLQ